jgi:hypothetical protein
LPDTIRQTPNQVNSNWLTGGRGLPFANKQARVARLAARPRQIKTRPVPQST